MKSYTPFSRTSCSVLICLSRTCFVIAIAGCLYPKNSATSFPLKYSVPSGHAIIIGMVRPEPCMVQDCF